VELARRSRGAHPRIRRWHRGRCADDDAKGDARAPGCRRRLPHARAGRAGGTDCSGAVCLAQADLVPASRSRSGVHLPRPTCICGKPCSARLEIRLPKLRVPALLMAGDVAAFAEEIERAARHPLSLMNEATLLWKFLYDSVDRYGRQHPEWTFARHEDPSVDPESGFRSICPRTGIRFAGGVAEALGRSTSIDNSNANVSRWRQQLDRCDIAALRASVDDISCRFYSDAEWPA
jgi:hypothetical protein